MIDVGGAALLGAAARNAAGVAAASRARTTTPPRRRAARARAWSARRRGRAWRPRRSAPSPPTTPRSPPTSTRSRATCSRPASRSSSRRSATCATARTRTSRRRSIARRPTAAGTLADATQLRGDRPSFNNLLDLDAAYRIAIDYTAPTVAIVKHTDPVGLASADELVEAYRQALETDPVAAFGGIVARQPRAGRGDRPRDRRELVRGRRRPGLQPGGARDPQGEGRAGDPRRPARPDRGHARLRHRQPRLQAGRRRAAGRDPRRARPRSGPAPGRHEAAADARRAERPAVRLAGGPPRPIERDRPRPERRDGRDRRRPGQPPGVRRDRASPGRRPGEDGGDGERRLLPVPGRDPDGGRAPA